MAFKTRHPLYHTWMNIIRRCTYPHVDTFLHYGGRGIKVCDRWLVFENFVADVGPKPSPLHTIDRIDNNGNYEPSNVRWATKKEQIANRRITHRINGTLLTDLVSPGTNDYARALRNLWAGRDWNAGRGYGPAMSDARVSAVKILAATGLTPDTVLGKHFDVHPTTIGSIRKGHSRAAVTYSGFLVCVIIGLCLAGCSGTANKVLEQQVFSLTGHSTPGLEQEQEDIPVPPVEPVVEPPVYVPPLTEECEPGTHGFRLWDCDSTGHRAYW